MHSRFLPHPILAAAACAFLPPGISAAAEAPLVSDAELPAWVSEQIEALQPKPEEKRLDEIGWADDIRHALRLAKEHERPVFLFTHDGRINLGRC